MSLAMSLDIVPTFSDKSTAETMLLYLKVFCIGTAWSKHSNAIFSKLSPWEIEQDNSQAMIYQPSFTEIFW